MQKDDRERLINSAIELHKQGVDKAEIGRRLGVSRGAVFQWISKVEDGRLSGPPSVPFDPAEAEAMKAAAERKPFRVTHCYQQEPVRQSVASKWAQAEERNRESIHKALVASKFSIELPEEPCAITFVSDQHISVGNTVDLKSMREDAELIASTDGVYAVLGGDGIDNHCLDEETDALTNRGWLRWDDIRPGDKVASLGPGGALSWEQVDRVIFTRYSGPIHRISSESVDMAVTPGHRVMFSVGDTREDAAAKPVAYELASEFALRPRSWIPIAAKSGLPDADGISDAELRVIGWIITDGWICGKRKDGSPIAFSIAQRESNCAAVERDLRQAGLDFSAKSRTTDLSRSSLNIATAEPLVTYRIGASSCERLRRFVPNKSSLPSIVWRLSDRQFGVFLDAVLCGDGSANGPLSHILYGNLGFLEEMQAACVTHGVSAKIVKVPGRPEHRLLINEKRVEQVVPKAVARADEYQGVVWCLNVPSGNFLARRSGKPFFTGNCKHRAAVLAARSTPDDQYELFEWYLAIFAERILAVISGNHDAWTNQIAGVDVIARICQGMRLCYAPDEAMLDLDVGNIRYKVGVRHQYRMNSSYNETHAVKQWWRMGNGDWDIGCIGHNHVSAIEPFWGHDREIWACRPGSYQITSAYSRQYGYNPTKPRCPTFIVYPDRKEIVGFHDLRQAVRMLKAERAYGN